MGPALPAAVTPEQARAIAKEAYIYGFPMVDNYRVQYAYYELPQSLLVANPLQRYLINSPMLTSLVPDPVGGYTFDIKNSSPGIERESNWLPAPTGPFMLVLRLYWPKPDALDGGWTAPQPVRA
jgi:hypothetical protein